MSLHAVAKIIYDTINNRWVIQRHGIIAEQGGRALGTEIIGFVSLDDALNFLQNSMKRDEQIVIDSCLKREGQ
jgi:hypothetical protein